MTLSPTRIISATEPMLTLAKRDCVSNDAGQLWDELRAAFLNLIEALGKGYSSLPETDQGAAYNAIDELHTAACHAVERGLDEWDHAGSVSVLSQKLRAAAAVLGFTLYDAVPINSEIEHMQEARDAAE